MKKILKTLLYGVFPWFFVFSKNTTEAEVRHMARSTTRGILIFAVVLVATCFVVSMLTN